MGHGQATPKLTRFELFLQKRQIMPAHLARECGYSRQHIYRLRMGQMAPTLPCVVAIVAACRRLSRSNVTAADLFPLESEETRK